MSLEMAGEFLLEMQSDAEATARADEAYLNAVRDIAAERGYDITTDELKDAMRAIAGLDDDDGSVEGFAGRFGSTFSRVFDGVNNDTLFAGPGDDKSLTITAAAQFQFSPLGFLRP